MSRIPRFPKGELFPPNPAACPSARAPSVVDFEGLDKLASSNVGKRFVFSASLREDARVYLRSLEGPFYDSLRRMPIHTAICFFFYYSDNARGGCKEYSLLERIWGEIRLSTESIRRIFGLPDGETDRLSDISPERRVEWKNQIKSMGFDISERKVAAVMYPFLRVGQTHCPKAPTKNSIELSSMDPALDTSHSLIYSKPWFHCTTLEAASQILKNGFKPSGFGSYGCGIYLTDNVYDAHRYAKKPGWNAILQISLMQKDTPRKISFLILDGRHTFNQRMSGSFDVIHVPERTRRRLRKGVNGDHLVVKKSDYLSFKGLLFAFNFMQANRARYGVSFFGQHNRNSLPGETVTDTALIKKIFLFILTSKEFSIKQCQDSKSSYFALGGSREPQAESLIKIFQALLRKRTKQESGFALVSQLDLGELGRVSPSFSDLIATPPGVSLTNAIDIQEFIDGLLRYRVIVSTCRKPNGSVYFHCARSMSKDAVFVPSILTSLSFRKVTPKPFKPPINSPLQNLFAERKVTPSPQLLGSNASAFRVVRCS